MSKKKMVKLNPLQRIDEAHYEDFVITGEPMEVTASQLKTLLQLERREMPLVVEVSEDDDSVSDNETESTETSDG